MQFPHAAEPGGSSLSMTLMTGSVRPDLAIRADAVTPRSILTMRRDGGGLITAAVHPVAAARLGLPFAVDIFRSSGCGERDGEIPYDQEEPFLLLALGKPPGYLHGCDRQGPGPHHHERCGRGEEVIQRWGL